MEIKEIDKLAKMCRIEISTEEKEELLGEMDSILAFVEQIQSVEVGKKDDQLGLVKNIFREDQAPHKKKLYTDSLLREAPEVDGNYFKVKNIL